MSGYKIVFENIKKEVLLFEYFDPGGRLLKDFQLNLFICISSGFLFGASNKDDGIECKIAVKP